jgi:hypothetical protein
MAAFDNEVLVELARLTDRGGAGSFESFFSFLSGFRGFGALLSVHVIRTPCFLCNPYFITESGCR